MAVVRNIEKRVNIQGLKKLARDVRRADKAAAKDLQRANKEAAGIVVDQARTNYQRLYPYRLPPSRRPGRRKPGFTVRGITARATATRASISIGGARRPWMLGQEFGSNGLYRQFVRPSLSGVGFNSPGRYLYPAIRLTRKTLEEQYLDLVFRHLKGDARAA